METIIRSGTETVIISPDRPMVLIGERINPTGRKKMAAALEHGNLKVVQEAAVKQVKEGAHILDVNVGVSGIDETLVLKEVVQILGEVTQVPLCIDSALTKAIQAGLEVYQGKALVNSVNGEERKLKDVLPIVKQYGAAVIGLTMDNEGIPKKAERRLEIAEAILNAAHKEGIPSEDIVIDPLAMAIGTDHETAVETLKALRMIRDKLGLNQTLGVSNISFGLPERHPINGIFLALAAMNGLTCSIVDPTIWEMRRAALITDLLMGKDEFCMKFISAFREKFPRD
jgi:5-methyltetrahydrofolate--homocysteine methyltransferase